MKTSTICLSLPFGIGMVNCYLVETGRSYVLIDTGISWSRAALERELTSAGCKPGDLALVVLTHGDLDHSGNAAHLRRKHGAKIAAHRGESDVIKRGDMTLSRSKTPFLAKAALGLFKLGKSDRFEPDLYVEEGQDLSEYGFDARVLHLPGHSDGSIGILAKSGKASGEAPQSSDSPPLRPTLFCGDLLVNPGEPVLNSIMDDLAAANASVRKLSGLGIGTVYPGHGEPFAMDAFLKRYRAAT
jgi:hydroxyacylglutathione hydrolase